MCEQAQELREKIEALEQINRLQAEALAEERDMNRKLTEALKEAREG